RHNERVEHPKLSFVVPETDRDRADAAVDTLNGETSMRSRCLFGPVSGMFHERSLGRLRRDKRCVAFDAEGRADLTISLSDTWEAVAARLPEGWSPDALVLWLPYTMIPAGLWSAPLPIIALAPDWELLWHSYRRLLPRCDLVVTDSRGAERMSRAGIPHV